MEEKGRRTNVKIVEIHVIFGWKILLGLPRVPPINLFNARPLAIQPYGENNIDTWVHPGTRRIQECVADALRNLVLHGIRRGWFLTSPLASKFVQASTSILGWQFTSATMRTSFIETPYHKRSGLRNTGEHSLRQYLSWFDWSHWNHIYLPTYSWFHDKNCSLCWLCQILWNFPRNNQLHCSEPKDSDSRQLVISLPVRPNDAHRGELYASPGEAR